MKPRIGIIDSGVSLSMLPYVAVSRRFDALPGDDPAHPDELGHGDRVARLIVRQCPSAELMVAQVFSGSLQTSTDRVAQAIGWLVEAGAQLINMSFGLTNPSAQLASACRYAAGQGVLMFASSPSCATADVYPAAFPHCISVTGDPRCVEGEIAWLGLRRATFGACSLFVAGEPQHGGGASFACARLTGIAARLSSLHEGDVAALLTKLREGARYIGPEVRRA